VYEAIGKHPEVMRYMPWNTFPDQHAFEFHFEGAVRSDPSLGFFLILNKDKLTPEIESDPEKSESYFF
jgi:hypothetical protein